MGARPIMELRKGDAAEDIDGDFLTWQNDLYQKLISMWSESELVWSVLDQSMRCPIQLILFDLPGLIWFGLVHPTPLPVCWNKTWGHCVELDKLLFPVLSLHFLIRQRLVENDWPRLGFSKQLIDGDYLHLLTRPAALSLRTLLGRTRPFRLHFCGCNRSYTHMQPSLTPFRKLSAIATLLFHPGRYRSFSTFIASSTVLYVT